MTAQGLFPDRIGRLEFFTWWVMLSAGVFLAVLAAIYLNNMHWLVVLFVTIHFAGTLLISSRRLHDLGHSGWLAMLLFVPLLNLALLILLLFHKGQGENKYGSPSPSRSAFSALFSQSR